MSVADFANTRVSILSGTVVDEFGDSSDAGTLAVQNVPAAIVETSERAWDPSAQVPRTVRTISAWVPQWAAVQAGFEGQQIYDEVRGDTYFVEDVVLPPSLTGAPSDVRLLLRRVSGPGT